MNRERQLSKKEASWKIAQKLARLRLWREYAMANIETNKTIILVLKY
jgi:hypothetical protein